MGFATLTDFWLPEPLCSLLTLALGASMGVVYDRVGRAIFRNDTGPYRALYFFSGLLLTSWLLFLLCLCGFMNVWLLRAIAGAFIVSGISVGWKYTANEIRTTFFWARQAWLTSSIAQRLLLSTVVACAACYGLVSLSPPTDADSLDYHLGIPVRILNDHNLWFDKNLLHFRMLGFGEMINLLGVGTGCVQLGSFIQYLALWAFIRTLNVYFPKAGVVGAILCLGVPVLLALIPSQKHLLTGAACTGVCFCLLLRKEGGFDNKRLLLLALSLCFAAGIKYNFLGSAFALFLFMMLQVGRTTRFRSLMIILGTAGVFLLPLLLYRFLYFGDPLSPVFEQLRANPDPVVVRFQHFVYDYRETGIWFPFLLLLPSGIGTVSTVLGISALTIVAALFLAKPFKASLPLFLLVLLLIVFGQKTARFFLEPYLWSLPLLLAHIDRSKAAGLIKYLGIAQLVLLQPFVIFVASMQGAGMLSCAGRTRLMNRSASFFAEAEWVKHKLPGDAVICTDIRSRALLSQRTLPIEYLYFTAFNDSAACRRFEHMLRQEYRCSYLVVMDKGVGNLLMKKYAGDTVAGPVQFPAAGRNPFRKSYWSAYIFRIER